MWREEDGSRQPAIGNGLAGEDGRSRRLAARCRLPRCAMKIIVTDQEGAVHELEGLDFDALPRDRQAAVAAAITRRETGIMAVSALVIFGLALRAAFTSPL
ncbi:MAG: hypothetical protein F9K43_30185 [Bauldia sp.]|nr:MAG: hypothetical protein F9K43_30185 [Bauldia sp.]